MKAVQEVLECLVVLAVLTIAVAIANARLPDRPTMSNIATSKQATVGDVVLFEGASMLAGWQIDDYVIFRVATSKTLGLKMVADPITGKWHSVPQS